MRKTSKNRTLIIKYASKLRKTSEYWKLNTATLITMLLPAAGLTGCMGIYEGGFECPAGTGVGCKSISEVNDMVNQCSVPSVQCSECRVPELRSTESSSTRQLEIWVNPLYLDSVSLKPPSQNEGKTEDSAEDLRKRIQEKINEEKDLHDKITL